ncbi:MAG: Uma2 family endonuclease [Hyphomicrobiaceae bacterium]
MRDAVRHTDMTVEEFLQWNLSQDERYELVDGVPVPLRAMAGAKDEHDTVVVNLIVALGSQLAGSPCRPKTADTALRTRIKRVRRPDVTIECAPVEHGSLEARNPVAVLEVLSPITRQLDRSEKLQEYLRHPSLTTVVHVDPSIMDVMVYTRGDAGLWNSERLSQSTDVIPIAGTSAALSLATVYGGVPLLSVPAPSNDHQDIVDEHR